MWLHPATQRKVTQVQADGAVLLGPAEGDQACGETGSGRMLEPLELLAETIAFFQPKTLAGRRVLITAGPTSETIDPIRVITNRSSGKMGYAIAQAAHEAGADVRLVSGPTALPAPYGVARMDVKSARDMHNAVLSHADTSDIFISVAAVADWYVSNASDQKLKKNVNNDAPTLEFAPNPDILADIAARPNGPFCVGFAAETQDLINNASAKRTRKGVPVLVGNLAQNAMDSDVTELVLFDDKGHHTLPSLPKLAAARKLVDFIASHLPDHR